MSQDLFNGLKVGIYLDAVTPGTEKRKSGETKIVTLSCRVEPFTADLATAIDDGVHSKHQIKPLLYTMNEAEPKSIVERLAVRLGCPRQRVLLFASSDTVKESLALHDAKITGITVRTSKDADGYVLTFKASFGPVGRAELEYLHDWYLWQRFAIFNQAAPSLEFPEGDDAGADQTAPSDADEKARTARPALEWEDDSTGSGKPADAPALSVVEQEVGQRHTLHTGYGGRGRRRQIPDTAQPDTDAPAGDAHDADDIDDADVATH